MSQWTHVAGIIRLDDLGYNLVKGMTVKEKQEKIREAVTRALGTATSRDLDNFDQETWNKCTCPQGSEGSLQYDVIPNSDKDTHSMSWGSINIWGDLRDFGNGDVYKIREWFQKSIDRLQKPVGFPDPDHMTMFEKMDYLMSVFSIREAVLCVEVEHEAREVITIFDPEQPKIKFSFVKLT
jgi:hypothetical protein